MSKFSLYELYPARAPVPSNNSNTMGHLANGTETNFGEGRSAGTQALMQLASVGTTLGISITGGIVAGNKEFLNFPVWR